MTDDLRARVPASAAGATPSARVEPTAIEAVPAKLMRRLDPESESLPDDDATPRRRPLWLILAGGAVASAILLKLLGGVPAGAPRSAGSGHPDAVPNASAASRPEAAGVPTAPTTAEPGTATQVAEPTLGTATGTPPGTDTSLTPTPTAPTVRPAQAAGDTNTHVAAGASDARPSTPRPATSAHETQDQHTPSSTKHARPPGASQPAGGTPVKAEGTASEQPQQRTPLQQALECLSHGQNDCVIHALEGKANTTYEVELLVATYRSVGDAAKAKREMTRYLEKFPDGPRVSEYQRLLHGSSEPSADPKPFEP
jgi:flagellar hook-length control protein FliK